MNKLKILFVCIHNSARSQMAEAFMNQLGEEKFEAESAGIEPGTLNPIVVEAMKEIDIDISGNETKSVDVYLQSGKAFDYVITVCDEASAERCPVFPGKAQKLHWSFKDPSGFQGSFHEKLTQTKKIRDSIKKKVEEFVSNNKT